MAKHPRAAAKQFKQWRDKHRAYNVGLLTRFTPALDVDLLLPKAAAAVREELKRLYPRSGVRIGRDPKFAVLFNTDKPFKKKAISFKSPDGVGRPHKLEFLGDGEQLVAYGVHPETEQEYRWEGAGPLEMPRDKLPAITEVEALQLLERLARIAESHGYERVGGKANGHDSSPSGTPTPWAEYYANIASGADLNPSLRKLAELMHATGQDEGAIINQLRGLMNNSAARTSDPKRWQDRYDSISAIVERVFRERPADDAEEIEPVDLFGQFEPPKLKRGLLPKVIEDFAFTQADAIGCQPGSLAMAALAVCSGALPHSIKLQMRQHNAGHAEAGRIWVALVGMPSTNKSPIMEAANDPLTAIDAAMRRQYAAEIAEYNALEKAEKAQAVKPVPTRLQLEDTTMESAQIMRCQS